MESNLEDTLDAAYQLMVDGSYAQALQLFHSIADREPMANLYLAGMYEEGFGVTPDLEQAERFYRVIANTNSSRGQFELGLFLRRMDRPVEAFVWIEKAALAGYLPAIYRLGWSYAHGRGVDTDKERARWFLQAAASRGHVFAQRDLALEMIRGGTLIGVVKWVSAVIRGIRIVVKDRYDERIS